MGKFIPLKELEVYRLSRELSRVGWSVYKNLNWQDKKIMGDQFIEATDSVGANIAEGYFRYHFLDRIKFYYNARASLAEAVEHWLELLSEREQVSNQDYSQLQKIAEKLAPKLNNFIASTYQARYNQNKKSP